MANHASSTLSYSVDSILLIAMGSGALMATLYHLITACLWHQYFQNSQQMSQTAAQSPSTADISVAHLIPAHKYRKKKDRASENEICAVCLGDFVEGEELKTLPECMHSFHVLCIDMWLYSHCTCPICRADALPSPAAMLPRVADSGEPDGDRNLPVLQRG